MEEAITGTRSGEVRELDRPRAAPKVRGRIFPPRFTPQAVGAQAGQLLLTVVLTTTTRKTRLVSGAILGCSKDFYVRPFRICIRILESVLENRRFQSSDRRRRKRELIQLPVLVLRTLVRNNRVRLPHKNHNLIEKSTTVPTIPATIAGATGRNRLPPTDPNPLNRWVVSGRDHRPE